MTTTSPSDEALDRLLSSFFKAELKRPWPAAPETPSTSEPARATESPRNRPAARDGSKARYTLAASVAILLGTCWTLSNGLQPGGRTGPAAPSRGGPAVDMNNGTADANTGVLGHLKKDKAENDNGGFVPPKIDLP